jgi:uncharacterized protein YraI
MRGGVFICYRREDSAGFARLIYERLTNKLGHNSVFFDVDNIAPGLDFVDILSERVGKCDALIAVIGRDWVSSADVRDQRRLDDPKDFVRVEIEAALQRKVRVIPVLVDGAAMPRPDELPDCLKNLTRRQGIEVSHTRFESDVDRLTRTLSEIEDEVARGEATSANKYGLESERFTRAGPGGCSRTAPFLTPAPSKGYSRHLGLFSVLVALAALGGVGVTLLDYSKPIACLLGRGGCPPLSPGIAEAACLKDRIAASSCGEVDDDYIVTNVSWNDADGGLNVRSQPSLSGAKLGVLPFNGTGIKITSCVTGTDGKRWCASECGANGLRGWVNANYVALRSGSLYSVVGVSDRDTGLKIRDGPDITCNPENTAPPNSKDIVLHLCQRSSDNVSQWCLITYKDSTGWVPYRSLKQQN